MARLFTENVFNRQTGSVYTAHKVYTGDLAWCSLIHSISDKVYPFIT